MQKKVHSFLIQYLYYFQKLSIEDIVNIIDLDEDEIINVINWAGHVVNILFELNDDDKASRVMEAYMQEVQDACMPKQSSDTLLKIIMNIKSDSH